MSLNIQRTGKYILFDTTQRYRMISLDERDFYIWRGHNRLELSDVGHEAAVILHEGDYVLFIPNDEPGFTTGIPHLACQEEHLYRIYAIPQSLPSEAAPLVDIIELPERVILPHLKV